jgi:hypothetical protein
MGSLISITLRAVVCTLLFTVSRDTITLCTVSCVQLCTTVYS